MENRVKAEWVLNHQFLLVHMKDVNSPPNYEAMVFIAMTTLARDMSGIGLMFSAVDSPKH